MGKNSGLPGMAEWREVSVRGSGLLEASKSLEKTKEDKGIAACGRCEEGSRGKDEKSFRARE